MAKGMPQPPSDIRFVRQNLLGNPTDVIRPEVTVCSHCPGTTGPITSMAALQAHELVEDVKNHSNLGLREAPKPLPLKFGTNGFVKNIRLTSAFSNAHGRLLYLDCCITA